MQYDVQRTSHIYSPLTHNHVEGNKRASVHPMNLTYLSSVSAMFSHQQQTKFLNNEHRS